MKYFALKLKESKNPGISKKGQREEKGDGKKSFDWEKRKGRRNKAKTKQE